MVAETKSENDSDAIAQRAANLFQNFRLSTFKRVDRWFVVLMIFQWLGGILASLLISPKTWAGPQSQTHPHVWTATVFGATIIALPIFLGLYQSGQRSTRHVIAVGQMLQSALLIHLSGGRIETHFHVFGSLAFLAFYADWPVLITASVVVALDHVLLGFYWPEAVYGVQVIDPWRWVEHAAWVVFIDIFLIGSCARSVLESRTVALRQAELERTKDLVEQKVLARTAELQLSQERFRQAWEYAAVGIALVDLDGRWLKVNKAVCEIVGRTEEELLKVNFQSISHPDDLAADLAYVKKMLNKEIPYYEMEKRYFHKEGHIVWVLLSVSLVCDAEGKPLHFVAQIQNITSRKEAEEAREHAAKKVASLNKQLVTAAHHAGMAEVASNVLHNVGNVLNSVNVSAGLVMETVRKSKLDGLNRTAELLKTQPDPAVFITTPQGKQLPKYIEMLSDCWSREQSTMIKELQSLNGSIEHIKQIVAMQQSYSKAAGSAEVVEISDLLEDAVRINAGGLERHGVKIVRKFADIPPICVEKHKVLQILINLVQNAKDAMDHCAADNRTLTIETQLQGARHVKIFVRDTGIGIPEENLTRIFAHGFSTRRDGHGFGLNSSALAARELGGALTVRSEGLGKGAEFTLELPVANGVTMETVA